MLVYVSLTDSWMYSLPHHNDTHRRRQPEFGPTRSGGFEDRDGWSPLCCTTNSQRPIPRLQHNEALVRVHKTGICGSDVHYLRHAKIGDYVMEEPMCLGHESAGTVVALGPAVIGLAIGDRVALEPGVGCGECSLCKGGQYEVSLASFRWP